MYNTISHTRVTDEFLPKIAREYNITREESRSSNRVQTTNRDSNWSAPIISTGCLSSFCSNNNVNLSSSQESSRNPKKKEEERTSPNYLQWIIMGSITAIATAFGLGRIQSAIAKAEENIWLSRRITSSKSQWDTTFDNDTASKICKIFETYRIAETNRKNKLSNYQSSLIGIAFGTGVGIIGACCNQQLVAMIGLIIGVVSVAFAAYQMAIHWDDFTSAQNKFIDFKLIQLIPQPQTQPPPPPGWNIPTNM